MSKALRKRKPDSAGTTTILDRVKKTGNGIRARRRKNPEQILRNFLAKVASDVKVGHSASRCLNNLILDLLKMIGDQARLLLAKERRKTLTEKTLKGAVLLTLGRSIGPEACKAGSNAYDVWMTEILRKKDIHQGHNKLPIGTEFQDPMEESGPSNAPEPGQKSVSRAKEMVNNAEAKAKIMKSMPLDSEKFWDMIKKPRKTANIPKAEANVRSSTKRPLQTEDSPRAEVEVLEDVESDTDNAVRSAIMPPQLSTNRLDRGTSERANQRLPLYERPIATVGTAQSEVETVEDLSPEVPIKKPRRTVKQPKRATEIQMARGRKMKHRCQRLPVLEWNRNVFLNKIRKLALVNHRKLGSEANRCIQDFVLDHLEKIAEEGRTLMIKDGKKTLTARTVHAAIMLCLGSVIGRHACENAKKAHMAFKLHDRNRFRKS